MHSISYQILRRRGTYRNAIGVFLADALGLGLALLKGVLVLELAAHVGQRCGADGYSNGQYVFSEMTTGRLDKRRDGI